MSSFDQNPEIPLFGVNGENRQKVKTYAILRDDPSQQQQQQQQVVDGFPTSDTEFNANNSNSNNNSSKSAWDYLFPSQEKLIGNVGARLAKRKQLFFRRKLFADISLATAMVGLLLAIIECELYVHNTIGGGVPKETSAGTVIKTAVTLSTLALLLLVLYYHVIDIRIHMIDNSQDDWRFSLTNQRLLQVAVEFIVCAIHPIPGNIRISAVTINPDKKTMESEEIPLSIILSLFMFMRLYLICRCLTLHSRLFEGAASQILGPLNRITLNFSFILKASLQDNPVIGLTFFILAIFFATSWALRICEATHGEEHRNMLNSMWLVSITFLTVGYGDIVPQTLCGRVIAVFTGVCGSAMTALIVAVIAKKLELSPSQRNLHCFVKWNTYEREIKKLAATIMKEGWRAYRARRRNQSIKAFQHQRNVIRAVHLMRKYKDLLQSAKNEGTMPDLSKTIATSGDLMHATSLKVTTLTNRLSDVENSLSALHQKIDSLLTMRR